LGERRAARKPTWASLAFHIRATPSSKTESVERLTGEGKTELPWSLRGEVYDEAAKQIRLDEMLEGMKHEVPSGQRVGIMSLIPKEGTCQAKKGQESDGHFPG
jgi:hypothetical protein